jgi:hypothetical protein
MDSTIYGMFLVAQPAIDLHKGRFRIFSGVPKCEDKDVVLPLCYEISYSLDGPR